MRAVLSARIAVESNVSDPRKRSGRKRGSIVTAAVSAAPPSANVVSTS
jgi:hypothetical protein